MDTTVCLARSQIKVEAEVRSTAPPIRHRQLQLVLYTIALGRKSSASLQLWRQFTHTQLLVQSSAGDDAGAGQYLKWWSSLCFKIVSPFLVLMWVPNWWQSDLPSRSLGLSVCFCVYWCVFACRCYCCCRSFPCYLICVFHSAVTLTHTIAATSRQTQWQSTA